MSLQKELSSLKTIGRGMYTVCKQIDNLSVYLITNCPTKEAYSTGWIESNLFPCLEFVDILDNGKKVYKSPYYPKLPLSTLDRDSYMMYRTLRDWSAQYYPNYYRLTNAASYLIDKAGNLPEGGLRDDIIQAIETLKNWSKNVHFEISPRNVRAVNGKLLLLDCFFID